MTPIPENPVASERHRADALAHLTNNRSNAFQADGYRGFTSHRNSAPSSTPTHPSIEPTSVSASCPPQGTSDANSKLSAAERLHCLLHDNENPFAGHEPVAPAGGLPGDEGPSDDPGDDPNDPNFYDGNLDDDNLPPDVDPTLIVLNNLVGVVSLLARNSHQANESSLQTQVCEPNTSNGTEAKKLHTFLVQCELNFQDCPRAFNED